MAPSRTIVAYLLLVIAFGALALEGNARLERWLDWLLWPARLCAELAAPIGWIQGHEAEARQESRLQAMRKELFEFQALEEAVLDSARSARSERHPLADYVHAEVVARAEGARDRIVARARQVEGLAPGMPVVSGEWFVGFLLRILPDHRAGGEGEIEIELITGSKARIAAAVRDGPPGSACELVVGGVAPPRGQVYLDVHQPSQRWVHEGRVEVYEPASLGDAYSALANGYQLGELVLATLNDEQGGTRTLACVRPGLDYEAGLYQLLVLKPRARERKPLPPHADIWSDGGWRPARLFLRAETSPWREGRKLAAGSREGVLAGAALVSGLRLVGRVERSAPYWSDVRMLGDSGLSLVALAMVQEEDDVRPHVLGRIDSRGRAPDGALLFTWTANLPLEGREERPARIWTGSGEQGVPRGLLIGDTMLPPGPGTHVLRILQPEGTREPRGLSVRIAPPPQLAEEAP